MRVHSRPPNPTPTSGLGRKPAPPPPSPAQAPSPFLRGVQVGKSGTICPGDRFWGSRTSEL